MGISEIGTYVTLCIIPWQGAYTMMILQVMDNDDDSGIPRLVLARTCLGGIPLLVSIRLAVAKISAVESNQSKMPVLKNILP